MNASFNGNNKFDFDSHFKIALSEDGEENKSNKCDLSVCVCNKFNTNKGREA